MSTSATTICDSPITKEHLETALLEHFPDEKNKLVNVNGKVISKGLGFLSDVMRLELEWTIPDNGMPKRIILKAPKVDNLQAILDKMGDVQIGADFVPTVHEAECKAYNLLKRENPPPVPIPHIYACWIIEPDRPGLLAMEDMTDRAGIINNIADGLSLNKWRNIVGALADLHAWSLTTSVPWREQIAPMESLIEMFRMFEKTNEYNLQQAVKNYPEYFGDVDQEFMLKEIATDNAISLCQTVRDYMDDVFLHGDTWVNNIMFAKNEDGSLSDRVAAFIDWQICFQGACVNDLTRLETWCINHELRRNHYREMLRFYYDRLKMKAPGKVRATFEEMEKLYELSFINNGVLSVMMIGAMLTAIAKVDEDPTGWRKKEMLERARAAYEDAVQYKNKK